MLLFVDDIIQVIENPADATWKLLELTDEFGKAAEYKINTQNPLHFYTLTVKDQKKKIWKTIPFTIAIKTVKHLGLNLLT